MYVLALCMGVHSSHLHHFLLLHICTVQQDDFEVATILAHRPDYLTGDSPDVEYLLLWDGFPDSAAEYVYSGNTSCRDLVTQYWERVATHPHDLPPSMQKQKQQNKASGRKPVEPAVDLCGSDEEQVM